MLIGNKRIPQGRGLAAVLVRRAAPQPVLEVRHGSAHGPGCGHDHVHGPSHCAMASAPATGRAM